MGISREFVNRKLRYFWNKTEQLNSKIIPQAVVIIVDTTYFKSFGILVIRAENLGENLYFSIVEHENLSEYERAINDIHQAGFFVRAIVADGFPGLKKLFPQIPFQKCHFHQFQSVTRYISRRPKLEAGIELRALMFRLKNSTKKDFETDLNQWYYQWQNFLSKKIQNPITGKTEFIHKRLRQAYFAIKRNLDSLFTFEAYPELNIPKTTNALDGFFGHLKSKIKNHRGISFLTKLKLIFDLIF